MERQVTEADAVRFFELAHVDLDVRRQGSEACVVLKDFVIPSEDLIPPKVREQIESWSDLIDYWSVDFDHRDETFHNQWQAYRTREEPALATQSDWHEYPEPGPLRDRREDHRHLRQRHDEARRGPDQVSDEPAPARRPAIRTRVPERRKPSEGTHLVNGVRAARRRVASPGLSRARARPRKRLLGFWFDDEHRTDDGTPVSLLLLPARGRRDVHLPDRDRAGPRVPRPARVRRARDARPARRDRSASASPSRWRRAPARRWR